MKINKNVTKKILLIFSLLFLFIFLIKNNKKDFYIESYKNLNDTVKYVGINACINCHYDIYSSYIQTGMGSSFNHATKNKSIIDINKKNILHDSISKYHYHPYISKDSLYVLEYLKSKNDTSFLRKEKINYIIGSGHHTNSHICDFNSYLFQAPFTFYAQDSILDLAPGYEGGFNSRFNRKIHLECMSCHNAYPKVVLGSENKYVNVPSGIDCERCHGPGEIHVFEKTQGIIIDTAKFIDYSIINPADLSPDLQFDICQRCHLQGNAVLKPGKSFFDFKPGQHLEDVISVFLPKYTNDDNFLMASHVERLKMSECFKKSDLNCISCHNPHKNVKTENINYFEAKCKKCHTEGENTICSNNKKSNCIECHMPNSESIDIPHVTITDHYIRKNITKVKDSLNHFLGLFSINEKNPDNLTLAEAYLNQFSKFQKSEIFLDSAKFYISKLSYPEKLRLNIYYSYLKQDYSAIINIIATYQFAEIEKDFNNKSFNNKDSYFWYRVGDAFYNKNLFKEAELFIKKSIELAPYILEFKNKLGVIYIKQNNLDLAKKIFQKIIIENDYFIDAYSNLANISIRQKQYKEAAHFIHKGLNLNPNHQELIYNKNLLFSFIEHEI